MRLEQIQWKYCAPSGTEGLSVLRTCVTKQTKDLRYIGRGTLMVPDFGLTHDDAVCPGKRVVSWIYVCNFCRATKRKISVSELCSEFGVSRPTGYRWINRFKESGPEGLLNLSSKHHSCSHATPEAIENAILALRGKYPSWGARKLKARLEQLDSSVEWPVASTFGNILQRTGLTSPKRKKRRTTPYSEPFSEVTAPN